VTRDRCRGRCRGTSPGRPRTARARRARANRAPATRCRRCGGRCAAGRPRRGTDRRFVGIEAQAVVDLGQHQVLLGDGDAQLLAEDLRVEQVLQPDTHSGRLVGVGGADAALGRAELVLAQVALDQAVELLVVRQDQVGVARHLQARAVDALGREHVHLGEQHHRVDHHAVADDRRDVVVEHAGRHELQGERLAVHHQRVAGVVAALVADDRRHLLGDEVGELALALIAPLGSDHDRRWHLSLLATTQSVDPTGSATQTPTRHRV
jgi:hypothetical protein